MSIRTRLAIAITLVLFVTLGLLGATVIRSTRATLVAQIDEDLRASAKRTSNYKVGNYDDGDNGPDDKGRDSDGRDDVPDFNDRTLGFYVYSNSGAVLLSMPAGYRSDPKPPPVLPDPGTNEARDMINEIVTLPAEGGQFNYRVLTQVSDDGYLIVTASPMWDVENALDRLARILIAVGLATLVLAAAVSWWLIRRGLRPVDRMVTTAGAIAAGDLSLRVDEAGPRTELGKLGQALNVMLGRIESAYSARTASEQRLRRFVADAAHELRTPLTSLRGYAELYRQGAYQDRASLDTAMGRIESESRRMARLVDDLLLLARLDQDRGLEHAPVDLSSLAREAALDFQAAAPDHPLALSLAEGCTVTGDETRLRQVIDNLLTNTRIHTPGGTSVTLATARSGREVLLAVSDTGRGIAQEDQERVFERFWRADPARSRSKGGSGLGLAIVASLVEAHGGSIQIDSAPGAGTTFTVRLPSPTEPERQRAVERREQAALRPAPMPSNPPVPSVPRPASPSQSGSAL